MTKRILVLLVLVFSVWSVRAVEVGNAYSDCTLYHYDTGSTNYPQWCFVAVYYAGYGSPYYPANIPGRMATYVSGWSSYFDIGVKFSAGDSWHWQGSTYIGADSDYLNVTALIGYTACGGCITNNLSYTIRNNSPVKRQFGMTQGGSSLLGPCVTSGGGMFPATGGQWPAFMDLQPGEQGTMNLHLCDTSNLAVVEYPAGAKLVTGVGGGCGYTNADGGYTRQMAASEYGAGLGLGSTNAPVVAPLGQGSSPIDSGGWTNGPSTSGTNGIGFPSAVSGSTNPTDLALVNGFGALYTATKEATAIAQQSRDTLYRIAGELGTNVFGGALTNLGGTNAGTDMSGTTNLLGMILNTERGSSNLFSGMAGTAVGSSNLLWGMGSSLAGSSNLLWGIGGTLGGISNGISGIGSNISAWFGTNLAWMTEGTKAIAAWSNSVGDGDKIAALRDTYISPLKGVADSERSAFEGGVGSGDSGAYAADSSITLLTFSDGGTTYTVDCDPLHNSALAEIWALVKEVFWWGVTCYYYYLVVGWSMRAAREVLLVPQMGFPKLTVFGNSVGATYTPVLIVIVMTAIAAVGQVLVAWVSGDGGRFNEAMRNDPLVGHPLLATSIAWFNAVVPWQYAVGLVLAGFGFRWQIFGVYMASAYTVKLCVK